MRVPATPACGIDWSRLHTLPVGVPPESLADADRVQYANALAASADIPLTTHGRYFTERPKQRAVRKTASGHVLPRYSAAAAADIDLPAAANNVVSSDAFSPRAPDPGTSAQVEAQLQKKLPYDQHSERFVPLPIPFRDLDTLRFYFAPQGTPPFVGTLGLNEPGVLPADSTLPTALPTTLLATRQVGQQVHLGELDRLLLRAPVTGRFRFEPYYVYRSPTSTDFEVVGPSNSGRLLVQQPALSTRERDPADPTDTKVFKERVFAFEHVDRVSVATFIHHVLVFQLAFVSGANRAFREEAGAEPRLAIPKSSPKVMGWLLTAVNSMLCAWAAFLSVLRWRPEDVAVATAIPAAWFGDFPRRGLGPADAKKLIEAVDELLTHADWVESLLFFAENVLAPKLAGYSWTEVLQRNGQDPAMKRFPVPKDQPPFTPKDDAAIKQHQRLRLVEDPKYRWLACYAGCPIGKPSRVYAPAPSGSTTFPVGGLTTFELEVLHAAGSAHTALGLGAPLAGTGPQAGQAMDLAPYQAQATGHACFFSAARLGSDSLHTTVDWLLELTRGIHFHKEEAGFLDLFKLMDPDTGDGHPLLGALRADDQNKAIHLRRQMDGLNSTTLAADSIAWWAPKVGFAAGDLTPATPYRDSRTRIRTFTGVLKFEDLRGSAASPPRPSGFDTFDIESAYLASARMCDPVGGANRLPIPVLLALMEREGIKLFTTINRHVKNVTSPAFTVVWEAYHTLTPRATFATDADAMGRMGWLLYPYGLDTFGRPKTDSGVNSTVTSMQDDSHVLRLEPGEDIARFIRERVWSVWHSPIPGADAGLPRIWKRSRRMHWAALSLMAGFFRHIEAKIKVAPTTSNEFNTSTWRPDPAWLPAGSSPPDLTGKTPADTEWKDYLTYYGLIYAGYNTLPENWRGLVKSAEDDHRALGSSLSLRDFFVRHHRRTSEVMDHVVRFAVGLDAFLRLDYMDGAAPKDYASATADTTDPFTRAWWV